MDSSSDLCFPMLVQHLVHHQHNPKKKHLQSIDPMATVEKVHRGSKSCLKFPVLSRLKYLGSLFSPSNNVFFTLPFFPPSKPFVSTLKIPFFPTLWNLSFPPSPNLIFSPCGLLFSPCSMFLSPFTLFFHPSPFLFHPRPFLFNPPPVKQVSHGTCTENDVTSGLFHTACPCTCQTLCFHSNSFLLY